MNLVTLIGTVVGSIDGSDVVYIEPEGDPGATIEVVIPLGVVKQDDLPQPGQAVAIDGCLRVDARDRCVVEVEHLLCLASTVPRGKRQREKAGAVRF